MSTFYNDVRAPSCPIAPSHPQSRGKLAGFPKSVRKFVSEVDTEVRPANSSPLCLLFDLPVFLVSRCGKLILLFTLSLLSLASCYCPDTHSWFSKQMNLNRKGIQRLLNVVLLIPSFWAVPGTRMSLPVQYLAESLRWPHIHASLYFFLLKCSHIFGQSRGRQREMAGTVWNARPARFSLPLNKSRKSQKIKKKSVTPRISER